MGFYPKKQKGDVEHFEDVSIESGGSFDVEDGGTFEIEGVAVTASAEELNKLSGSGAVVPSGTAQANIADPTGGTTTDAEARAAINSILDVLEHFGLMAAAE